MDVKDEETYWLCISDDRELGESEKIELWCLCETFIDGLFSTREAEEMIRIKKEWKQGQTLSEFCCRLERDLIGFE